jgi:soluble P-type ATPase
MIKVEIPGFGLIECMHLVSDFNGTLAIDGKLLPGIRESLNKASELLKVHIFTGNTFGTAEKELSGIHCETIILTGEKLDVQKQEHINRLGAEKVIAIGNGNNDRLMLKAARLGIAVCLAEGCALDAVLAAKLIVKSPFDAIALLLNPERLKATLRT